MEFNRILECIPNFSEGHDLSRINQIAYEIEKVEGVKLLHVDPGKDANRTVITFAGIPEAVAEAAFRATKKASELIDMRFHKGVHPRIGATDVLPLVPVKGITMDETIALARKLAERIGNELSIHVYCYENAAFEEKRRNLANCRMGEYEGLSQRLISKDWRPDFGPENFNSRSGATIVGARDFLIAYNISLQTKDVKIAREIAAEIRESGEKRIVTDDKGEKQVIYIPGLFKGVKAIGWYLPDYEKVQVSTNITNIRATPLHVVFETVKELTKKYSIGVTGSELIGLIPKSVLIDAGKYYSGENYTFLPANEMQVLKKAVEHLQMEEFVPFHIRERVLEYALER